MREWILKEQSHAFVREQHWEVAVLPFGATEPHNLHMPYGTDIYQVDAIGERACEKAYRAGAKVLLLPAIPYGVNTNYFKVPGAVACSVTPSTLSHLVADLVDSLERQGIPKLLLLNGHGGNELKPVLRELHHRTKVFLSFCDWFRMANDVYPSLFERPGEHADEVESSLGLAYFPNLMHMELADEGSSRPTRFEAIDQGWVGITRPWHLATTNTGMGNPQAAAADKGRKVMEVLVERLGDYLIALAKAPIDDQFPYDPKPPS